MHEDQMFSLNFDLDVSQVDEFPDAVFRAVIIPDEGSETTHTIHIDERYWQELTGGKVSPDDLVRETLEYLLRQESNEAIMQEFNLRQVSEYFSEYENYIRQTL